MYSILIVSFIVLIITIFGANGLIQKPKRVKNDPTYSETQEDIIGNCIITNILTPTVVFIIVSVISFFTTYSYYPMEEYSYSFDINSLEDNLATEGKMQGYFCMSGYINEELYYYYSRALDKGDKIEHISASQTYLNYDDQGKPNITVYKEKSKYPTLYKKLLFTFPINHVKYYVLTLPKSAITNTGNYNIDMK